MLINVIAQHVDAFAPRLEDAVLFRHECSGISADDVARELESVGFQIGSVDWKDVQREIDQTGAAVLDIKRIATTYGPTIAYYERLKEVGPGNFQPGELQLYAEGARRNEASTDALHDWEVILTVDEDGNEQ